MSRWLRRASRRPILPPHRLNSSSQATQVRNTDEYWCPQAGSCPSFVGSAAPLASPLCRLGGEVGESDQVERGAGQLRPELVLTPPDVAQLAASRHRLPPAEDLLDPLSQTLAHRVAEVGHGPPVDGATVLRIDVLGYVRRHLQIPAAANEVLGVIALVAAHRPASLTAPPPVQHEDYVLQLSRNRGPAAAGSLAEGSPAPAHQLAMPAQDGGRREEQAGRRQVAADGGQDQAITRGQFRTLDLATEDGQLMTQGQELEFALLLRFPSHQEEGDQEAQARIDGSVEHGGGRWPLAGSRGNRDPVAKLRPPNGADRYPAQGARRSCRHFCAPQPTAVVADLDGLPIDARADRVILMRGRRPVPWLEGFRLEQQGRVRGVPRLIQNDLAAISRNAAHWALAS